jgi:hypothetical protein
VIEERKGIVAYYRLLVFIGGEGKAMVWSLIVGFDFF